MNAERYPFDYDALQKGQIIPVEMLEDITGTKKGTAEFALKVLSQKQNLETELWLRGKLWTISGEGCDGGLKILTDEEASIYNAKRFEANVRGMHRSHSRLMGVDVSSLTAEQRGRHERELCNQAAKLMAIKKTKKLIMRRSAPEKPPELPPPPKAEEGGAGTSVVPVT